MSRIQKLLAVFLSVVLFLGAFSTATPVFAQEVTDAIEHHQFVQDAINNPAVSEDTTPEAEIAFEVEEKRDEYTKVYKKEDGTYTAVMSAEPLHYMNDGAWEEINNSLLLEGDVYTNAENSFNVQLPESLSSSDSLTVGQGGYEISFSVEGVSESPAVVENNIVASETDVLAADEAIAQTQSSVTYADVAENTDLQYVVTSNSIKENIIVSDKESVKEAYTFTFETNGLNIEKQDDGSVEFKDDAGEVKFRIPRPVMTDTALAFSYDIDVDLIYNTDGTITLEYSPSMEWINSTDRVYPINIDPAIVVEYEEPDWVEDTCVISDSLDSTAVNRNYYNDYVGAVANGTTDTNRTLYGEVYTKFNIDAFKSLGSNVVFTEAQYLFDGGSTNGIALAKKIKTPIDFQTVTYTSKPTLEDEVIDYYTSPYTGYDNLPFSCLHFNITKPLNEWFNGEANNGFAVVTDDEDFYGALILNGVQNKTNSTVTYTTFIVLDYVDMGGYNQEYNYDTFSAEKAGNGYVDYFSQKLTVIRDDIVAESNTIPVTISMIYNSAIYDKIEELNQYSLLAYGENWVPSYLRAIFQVDDKHMTYYTEKGDAIDFVSSTDSSGNIIFTEMFTEFSSSSGYEVKFNPATDGKPTYISVITPDGYMEMFNEVGLLESVSKLVASNENGGQMQSSGESINITYDVSHRINSITDTDDRIYDFVYDSTTGRLNRIECQTLEGELLVKIPYTYDDYGNLVSVSHYDGSTATYSYDTNGNITSATTIEKKKVNYTYENNRVKSVIEQFYTEPKFVDEKNISFERLNSRQLKIYNGGNYYKMYCFDVSGKLSYIYDSQKDCVEFEDNQDEQEDVLYIYPEKHKISEWQSAVTESFDSVYNSGADFEIQAGLDKETVVYKTVEINGEKGDAVTISGWIDGCFSNSSTNNDWLNNLIETEDTLITNFTKDRFAQIEVSYQYEGCDNEGNIDTYTEKIVILCDGNVGHRQLVTDMFTLTGDCQELTVCIRFSKNANPLLLSDFGLAINKQYQLFDDTNGSYSLRLGNRVDSPVILSFKINGFGQVTTMTYKNEVGEETNFVYEYVSGRIEGICVNNIMRHRYTYDQTTGYLKSITSADDRIVRYVDKDTLIPTFINNPIYANEDVVCDYVEEINEINYHTLIDRAVYEYDIDDLDFKKCLFTESSNVFSENGKGIGVQTVQDWYGRRISDTIQLQGLDEEIGVESFAKLETKYGYGDELSFGTLNDIKTYTNTIYTPNEQSALSENYSFLYEYDENGNVIEEYNYISENSMELRYSYQYNKENQLVRYNDNVSDPKCSYTYTYDDSGRVISKSTYTYAPPGAELENLLSTECYEYSGNVLTEYDNNAVENDINNYPTSYCGAVLTWENNQLASYTYTDDAGVEKRILYTYDENGYISSKTIQKKLISSEDEQLEEQYEDIENYQYTWAYGKLINQVHTDYSYTIPLQTVIKLVYDSYNSVQGFIVNDTASYIYLKNLQGDIIGVVNEAGEVVASYSYDVWGKQTVTTTQNIVGLLPLAYRGYFFDNYANLYFIDKRAYNPNLGKFLDSASAEAEGLPEVAEYNMYTYWENNPVWYMTKEEKEAYKAKSIANYLHNKKVTEEILNNLKAQQVVDNEDQLDTIIYNQGTDAINQYSCGVVTARPKGCAWISTYNASKLLGMKLTPEYVIREYEEMGIFIQGFFGVHPFAVARFFKDRGYKVKVSFDNFEDEAKNCAVNIMYYNGKPVGHYAAIEYKNDEFLGYNVFGSTKTEELGQEITIPVTIEDTTRRYTGKVLISISPKEQSTVVS